MPRVGLMALLAIPEGQSQLRLRLLPSKPRPLQPPLPVFAFRGSKSKMATPVVSLPVPAVVGTERSKRKLRRRQKPEGASECVLWLRPLPLPTPLTCDQGLQRSRDRLPFSDWSVDKVQEVCVRVARVQIGCFTGVNHRASAHRHKHIKGVALSKRNGLFEASRQKYNAA